MTVLKICTNANKLYCNKLVTIFARHLDNFIMTQNLSSVYQIHKTGTGQFFPPGQIYHSPGLAKLRYGVLHAGPASRLKHQD
jgi:hypothetical protein